MSRTIELTRGFRAVVDDEDYDRLAGFSWYAHTTGGKVYARRKDGHSGPTYYMHREILGVSKGTGVDHRDGDGLNNQRSNLRVASQSQNMQNRVARSGCSSKYKGVHFYKARGNWTAQINSKSLGYFPSEELAALAYNAAALKEYGEFARLNEVSR